MLQELVILVDDDDNPVGTAPKAEVHHQDTPLHRAFSCFLFNEAGELLLQQRASSKVTWPEVWSNSCCGHPLPDERPETAVHRRLHVELGLAGVPLGLALPKYRYRAEHLGVVENEICPVWVGFTSNKPVLNTSEVQAVQWMAWEDFLAGVREAREPFFRDLSPWCREETVLLAESGAIDRARRELAP
jgi:isopentenyl-diphosphate delta-isomerase